MSKLFKFIASIVLIAIIALNVIAYNHARRFTHFAPSYYAHDKVDESLRQQAGRFETLIFGVYNPRPMNTTFPRMKHERVDIQGKTRLEAWWIRADEMTKKAPKGNVILFHGYRGNKSTMLDKAEEFLKLGYHTLIVDFRGSGGSEGDETSIGFHEAEDVKMAFAFLSKQNTLPTHLFGSSMGAVAILKAMHDYHLPAKSVILECPFGSMYQAVEARVREMQLPTNPTAALLVFWGGAQQGFWGFSHHPTVYARSIKVPTLLLWGEKDPLVSREEIGTISANLRTKKKVVFLPNASHADYLVHHRKEWIYEVERFLK